MGEARGGGGAGTLHGHGSKAGGRAAAEKEEGAPAAEVGSELDLLSRPEKPAPRLSIAPDPMPMHRRIV